MISEMKLSDALEAGWKIAPQSWKDGWGRQNPDGSWRGVCAVGAAILGTAPETPDLDLHLETGFNYFPQLFNSIMDARLPEGLKNPHEHGYLDLGDVIQSMNDWQHRPGSVIVAYLRQQGY